MLEDLFNFIGFSFLTVLAVWMVRDKYQLQVVATACLLFLFYSDTASGFLLLSTSLSVYYLSKKANKSNYVIMLMICGLSLVFVYYKLSSTLENGLYGAALPLGMSFYIFRLLHYVIEVYKGNMSQLSLGSFLSYMLYLPVIVIGPIIRIEDWLKEAKRRRWNSQLFSSGMERMLYGLVKIVVLGNYLFSFRLSRFITSISDDQLWLATYLDCVRYSGNSYLQFAGYSDIVIGFSLMLGIKIQENFNYPFLASNINDFWKRWHISLSQWCRDYIFTPIASSTRLPWFAIIVSMLVLGLWHELSPRYILWASFHGIGIVIWNFYNRTLKLKLNGLAKKLYHFVCIVITVNFVIISFVWIKESSAASSIAIFKILLGL